MESFMIGYTLKHISHDQMILDMPYPNYQIFEYVIVAQDDEIDDTSWNVYNS